MKRVFLIAIGIMFLSAGSILAVKLMDVVPQKIGFKDVSFDTLDRKGCADCHGDSLVDTHHGTKPATTGKCTTCHTVSTKSGSVGVLLERNCMKCHTKSPHHKTAAALNKECTSCHESPGVGDYTMKGPGYKPTKITPTKANCKNCHRKGKIDGVNVLSIKKAHHGIGLKGCNICHDEKNKSSQNIRVCERCHTAKAIHEVLPHVDQKNCVGCHDLTVAQPKKKDKKKKK